MGLRTLLIDLARDRDVKIDVEELDAIGLTDDESPPEVEVAPDEKFFSKVDLSSTLPGSAAGMAEIFLEAPKGKVVERDGLLWSPIAVEGQWATRPDGKGGKTLAPLRLVAGSSTNQRRQIGMKDILDNFVDGAVEDVTIPTTHNNGPLENTGFVEKLALVDGKSKGKTVKVLMAGERYTDKHAEQKVKEGSTRGRSMGLLYDYVRTDTAKEYPVALEHVALTPKPWLRGMPKLRRPLSAPDELATVSLSLSDDGPDEDDLETMLSEAASDEPTDFLAEPAIQWSHEDSPKWLQDQVNAILYEARRKKIDKKRSSGASLMVDEPTPSYRCKEAKPGQALIADDWGDGANYWVAGITVTDGKVVLDDFKDWSSTKQVWVADQREQPTGDKAPLSDNDVELTSIELAQARRSGREDLAELKAKKRDKLPDSSFAIPDERKFPMHDEAHARNALARAAGTKYEARVRTAVKKRWPGIDQEMMGDSITLNVGLTETADPKKIGDLLSARHRAGMGIARRVRQEHLHDPNPTNDPPRGGGEVDGKNDSTLQLSDEARRLIQEADDRAAAAEAKAKQTEEQLAETNKKVDTLLGTANVNAATAFITHLKTPVDAGGLGLSEERGWGGMLVEIERLMLADDGGPAVKSDHFADDKDNKDGTLTISGALKRVFGALRTAEGSTLKLGEIIEQPIIDKDGKNGKPPKEDAPEDLTNLSDDEILAREDPEELTRAGIKVPASKVSANGDGKGGD